MIMGGFCVGWLEMGRAESGLGRCEIVTISCLMRAGVSGECASKRDNDGLALETTT